MDRISSIVARPAPVRGTSTAPAFSSMRWTPSSSSPGRRHRQAPPAVVDRRDLAAEWPVMHDALLRSSPNAPATFCQRLRQGARRSVVHQVDRFAEYVPRSPSLPALAHDVPTPPTGHRSSPHGFTTFHSNRRTRPAQDGGREVSPGDHQLTDVRRAICRIPGNDARAVTASNRPLTRRATPEPRGKDTS